MKYIVEVKHGNAVDRYRTVEEAEFHSEFGARLFGFLTCREAGMYHYWTVKGKR